MKLPEYVTGEEVKRVCTALGIRDWTRLKKAEVKPEEAQIILNEVKPRGMKIPLEEFRAGLEVELEHGTRYKEANVTNNHPLLTGKIVVAHLKESMDYYERLEVAEIEGDLLKAFAAKNLAKAEVKYKKLVQARLALVKAEADTLS
ncbi:MAG: hypothetical protein HY879_09340 [Deltaproteobacteria bacterium]|nr:hypothetical protein [Deltaproteobacteria bacterium]